MKRAPLFAPLVLAVVLTGLLGTSAPASADPIFRPEIFPDVEIVPPAFACADKDRAVTTARATHAAALLEFQDYEAKRLRDPGSWRLIDLYKREQTLLTAAAALNQALYDQAQCRLEAEQPRRANFGCTTLAFELNRARAMLDIARRQFSVAQAIYNMSTPGAGGTAEELKAATTKLEEARTALRVAGNEAAVIGGLVAILRRLGACGGFQFQPRACNQPLPGAELTEPTTATASTSTSGTDDPVGTESCIALDEGAVPDGELIDSYEEWVAVLDTVCDANPDCGVVALSDAEAAELS